MPQMNPHDAREDYRRDQRSRLRAALLRWPPTVGQMLVFSGLLNLLLGAALAVAVLASSHDRTLSAADAAALSHQLEQLRDDLRDRDIERRADLAPNR